MRNDASRALQAEYEEPDEWLLDAARRAGHKVPYAARSRGTSAWRILLSAGLADAAVLELACDATGTEPADFSALSPALSNLFSHAVAKKHHAVPIGIRNGIVGVATSNPRGTELERELNAAARRRVRLYAASPTDVIRAQGIVYGTVYATRPDSATLAAPLPTPQPFAAATPARLPTPQPFAAATPAPLPTPRPFAAATAAPLPTPKPFAAARQAPAPAPVPRLTIGIAIPAEAQDDAIATPPVVAAPPAADPTDRLFQTALDSGATEVVLEPIPDGALLLRLRIGGQLTDRYRIAATQAMRVVQLLEARASLGAAPAGSVRRGRTTFATSGGTRVIEIDAVPVDGGRERIVLRFRSDAPSAALRVLLVDDDVVARRTLARELATGGIEVLEAADGVAALAFVKRLHPHVVLTEVALPRLDAIGILEALAANRDAPRVVVRTEQTDGAMDGWLREAGAADVMKRAVESGTLVARLRELAAGG